MRVVQKFEPYETFLDTVQIVALEWRQRFGENLSVGVNGQTLYRTWRHSGNPPVQGGKTEPVYFNTLSVGGLVTVFLDEAVGEYEYSTEVPDA